MSPIRISGKDLGVIALPDFCSRCFWIKMKCDRKLPFQIFPGIFSSIDSYTKKVTNFHHQRHGTIPKWFSKFGDFDSPVPAPHFSKFCITDKTTNITLSGQADEILRKKDGSLFILDYKTAKFTDNADELLPMYEVQLNAYALIAEQIGMGKVSGLGLVYYEPMTDLNETNLGDHCLENGFSMHFHPHLLSITLDTARIPPLLQKVREINDLAKPPRGLEGCEDCERIGNLLGAVGE